MPMVDYLMTIQLRVSLIDSLYTKDIKKVHLHFIERKIQVFYILRILSLELHCALAAAISGQMLPQN